ncbi:cobalamin-dependent protein, partial [bacterium]|nr:cobalamin-dependent protein [bacterium]
MRVLMVNPPIAERERGNPVIAQLFYNSMPLGIGYLAAIAEWGGHEAHIIDAAVERLTMGELQKRAADIRPDLIGVTALTTSFQSSQRTIKVLRGQFPDAFLMVGGPHISAWGLEAIGDLPVDAAVAGEGECAFQDILAEVQEGRPVDTVPGIIVKNDDGRWAETGHRRLWQDMDTLPFPARHLFKKNLYAPIPADYRALPKIPLYSARGCPYGCVFCDKSVFGARLRGKSPERTVDEMEHCARDHGAKGIAFLDSTFGTNKRRAIEICEEILRRGLKVDWTCTLRADSVDEATLRLYRQAGCWRVRLGIETGDPEILRRMDKGENIEHIRRAAVAADKAGLQVKAFFQVGHMGETRESIKRTIAFAKSLPLMEATVQINTPMKNTPQEHMWPEYGRVISDNLTDSSFWEPVFVPHGFTPDELVKWQNRFYREFLLRPSLWWRHLRHMRTVSDIKRYISAVKLVVFLMFNKETGENASVAPPDAKSGATHGADASL